MMNPQTIKINRIEDIDVSSTGQDFIQLEIYLKNTVISLPEINGNLYVRASGCTFPNLKRVLGNLSIDAEDVSFPGLETVVGDCNIHEKGSLLSKLKVIGGNLKVLTDVGLPNLEQLAGKLIKEDAIHLAAKFDVNHTIFIKHQSEVDLLPPDGAFNLEITSNNITIGHTMLGGNLTIKGSNISFPNLINLNGKLTIGNITKSKRKDSPENIKLPLLKNINRDLITNARHVNLDALKKVNGSVTILGGGINFRQLTYVKKLHINTLENIFLYKLEVIDGDFSRYREWHAPPVSFPRLKFINGKCLSEEFNAPVLTRIGGDVMLRAKSKVPNLEYIGGEASFSADVNLAKLKYIFLPSFERFSGNLPALERIENLLFNKENPNIPRTIVNNYYFQVSRFIFLSLRSFAISNGSLFHAIHRKISINRFIAILKMKHLSFQSFETKEVKETWQQFESEEFQKIMDKLEKRWNYIPPITLEQLFKIKSRTLRLFCFKYVGVNTLMEKLQARKISAQGIDLDYFRYDRNGNKISFKKHNIFEVYEAERNNLTDLKSWDNEKIYAVKCWCSSTNKEHWLWIESRYASNPLTAIASTFRVHENIIPHIKSLKRQGDILICEMKKNVLPEGNIRPLTKDEYFRLLEVES